MPGPLSNASSRKIHHLIRAKFAVEQALSEIREALGDSDVTNSYEEDLYIMIHELETDIEDAWADRG
jgi:hypothetical protein